MDFALKSAEAWRIFKYVPKTYTFLYICSNFYLAYKGKVIRFPFPPSSYGPVSDILVYNRIIQFELSYIENHFVSS